LRDNHRSNLPHQSSECPLKLQRLLYNNNKLYNPFMEALESCHSYLDILQDLDIKFSENLQALSDLIHDISEAIVFLSRLPQDLALSTHLKKLVTRLKALRFQRTLLAPTVKLVPGLHHY
jgi:hypothetical protein